MIFKRENVLSWGLTVLSRRGLDGGSFLKSLFKHTAAAAASGGLLNAIDLMITTGANVCEAKLIFNLFLWGFLRSLLKDLQIRLSSRNATLQHPADQREAAPITNPSLTPSLALGVV